MYTQAKLSWEKIMFDFIVSVLQIVIFVSAIGSFVVLKPLFNSFTKTQKMYTLHRTGLSSNEAKGTFQVDEKGQRQRTLL